MFRPRAAAKHKAFVPYIKESGVLTLSREELHIAVCTTFGSKKVPLYTIVYGLGWGWRSKSDAWRNYRWSCGLYAEPCTAIVLNHDKTLIERTRWYWVLVGEITPPSMGRLWIMHFVFTLLRTCAWSHPASRHRFCAAFSLIFLYPQRLIHQDDAYLLSSTLDCSLARHWFTTTSIHFMSGNQTGLSQFETSCTNNTTDWGVCGAGGKPTPCERAGGRVGEVK